MQLPILRPRSLTSTDDKWKELERYLLDHWERATAARQEQVDGDYDRWTKNYYGIPRDKTRTIPWYNASNFVVPLIRIFLDTFVARTLNVIFATRPIAVAEGYPREEREALEAYINRKALYEWQCYKWVRALLTRGNKNGTLIIKTPWIADETTLVSLGPSGEQVETPSYRYLGPKPAVVPFEDFYIYPITANDLDETVIRFHRIRLVEEQAKKRKQDGILQLDDETLEQSLKTPADVKRGEEQSEAHVVDTKLRELQVVECYLNYELSPGRYYELVCLLCPDAQKLVDIYFYPYPNNEPIYREYKPFPREDFFYGESMCELLAQLQEEVSVIHNDRRNNSYIANAPVFKRRNGSLLPNPSTVWYPGKVFDLESMEDLEVVTFGRNYDDMIQQESFDLQLGERLSGIGSQMQGYAGGMMGKRGIYNASGTIALMQEGNQRQDTNIRDARLVIGGVLDTAYRLQLAFNPSDSVLDSFPLETKNLVIKAMGRSSQNQRGPQRNLFLVQASSAAQNQEVKRQNLIQMANVLGQYGQSTIQLSMQLANPSLNPALRMIMNDIVRMQKWLAGETLKAFDELDVEGVLPDVAAALNQTSPGSGGGTKETIQAASGQGMDLGAGGGAEETDLTRQFLQTLSQVPTASGGNGAGTGLARG